SSFLAPSRRRPLDSRRAPGLAAARVSRDAARGRGRRAPRLAHVERQPFLPADGARRDRAPAQGVGDRRRRREALSTRFGVEPLVKFQPCAFTCRATAGTAKSKTK